jgi:hypothetical protein
VTPRNLRELVARLPRLRHHFRELLTPEFAFLPAQLELMADVLEAAASNLNEAIPMLTIAEIVVAMEQLTAGHEQISTSRTGFHDGAVMAGMVLEHNRAALQRFAATKGILWSSVEPNPIFG